MPTFEETFLCTAMPTSVTGTKLRLAVLVSPRLLTSPPPTGNEGAPAALDNWPDARDWPEIQPSWQVTITQGATSVTLPATEVVTTPYDAASWSALFPPDMEITPYAPTDRSVAPIRSYPVAAVRDATKDLHVKALAGTRTDFQTVDGLVHDQTFSAILQAADPAFIRHTLGLLAAGPVSDASLGIAESFALGNSFHDAGHGPALNRPVVTKVDPKREIPGTQITITGTHLAAPVAVHFGTVPATHIASPDDTHVTCTAPQGPAETTVDVRVTTPEGTSTPSPADKFTFPTVIIK